jgi:hypothetical protein
MISEMEAEVRKFQAELAEKVGMLREKFPS